MLPRSLRPSQRAQRSLVSQSDQPPDSFRAELLALIRDGMKSDEEAKRLRRLLRVFIWPLTTLCALTILTVCACICAIFLMIVHAGAIGTVADAFAGAFGAGSVGKGLRDHVQRHKNKNDSTGQTMVPKPLTSPENVQPGDAGQLSSDQGATR